jgi:hypothetical protein
MDWSPEPELTSARFPRRIAHKQGTLLDKAFDWRTLLLIIFCLALILSVSIVPALQRLYILKKGITAIATVQRVYEGGFGKTHLSGGIQTHFVIDYVPVNGQHLTGDVSVLALPSHQEGMRLLIHYLLNCPRWVVADDDYGQTRSDLILDLILLIVVGGIAATIYFFSREPRYLLQWGNVLGATVEGVFEKTANISYELYCKKYVVEVPIRNQSKFHPGQIVSVLVDSKSPTTCLIYSEAPYRIVAA